MCRHGAGTALQSGKARNASLMEQKRRHLFQPHCHIHMKIDDGTGEGAPVAPIPSKQTVEEAKQFQPQWTTIGDLPCSDLRIEKLAWEGPSMEMGASIQAKPGANLRQDMARAPTVIQKQRSGQKLNIS